ncbi:hypothetical protein SAY87_030486 [Trapa incisa]|uniref:MACPF domain-containing protein n=1 Tax=Trapa incisa TaxID=236973 RepID=A0AAN7QJY5_9MYRT|nr:hypothetical protein SAY87_030486 [Trapa incisa]
MSFHRMDPLTAVERAVSVIGMGYDLTNDIRLSSCKSVPVGSRLIELDDRTVRDLVVPGGLVVKDVPSCIMCDKGEVTRLRSDVLSFNQMSEHFNQELSLSSKIPCGLFNTMFGFSGGWQKDASTTKSLALDGWFISLYGVELGRSQLTLLEHVKEAVPSSWDPPALAEFIEKYGTHIVMGVKMGGKEVVHMKQFRSSTLQPAEVQKFLKQLADQRFSEDIPMENPIHGLKKVKGENFHRNFPAGLNFRQPIIIPSKNNDTVCVCIRRGGVDYGQSHKQWLSTISQSPNVISMSFVPITSLLSGVRGCGFLSHAINLYLRYKPPIEELHQFLEFQLPRQWAPVYADLPLGPRRRKQPCPTLQFTFMGPKLYVNTMQVDTENRPVTGIRLFLEGKKSNHLAIHLQHLTDLPSSLQISDDHTYEPVHKPIDPGYFEPLKWSLFSHVCTAPIDYNGSRIDDSASIVTKAWLEVKVMGIRKVLFLRLGFSMVESAKIRRSEWDGPSNMSRKSGIFSSLISTRFSANLNPPEQKPAKVDLNSAVFAGGPPQPNKLPKMTSFVDTKEMVRGPEDPPGYWVVTGAKLSIEGGKISVKAKYSLLTILSEESMML